MKRLRWLIMMCGKGRQQATKAQPPGLLLLLFYKCRAANGRGMGSEVECRPQLAVQRVHLETRVLHDGGEKSCRHAARFLPQPLRVSRARGKDFLARCRRYSGLQGVADRSQSLRCPF